MNNPITVYNFLTHLYSNENRCQFTNLSTGNIFRTIYDSGDIDLIPSDILSCVVIHIKFHFMWLYFDIVTSTTFIKTNDLYYNDFILLFDQNIQDRINKKYEDYQKNNPLIPGIRWRISQEQIWFTNT